MRRIKDIEMVREALRQEVRLEDVAHELGVVLRSGGHDKAKALCPFHDENEPSFTINTAKQLYYCHGCKRGGDLFGFVQRFNSLSHDEAIAAIAEFAQFDLSPFYVELTAEEKYYASLYRLNEFVVQASLDQASSREFKAWIQGRHIPMDIVEEYRVGFASKPPSRQGAKAEEKDWKALGLNRKDQWTDVIVIPQTDIYGRITGFRNRPLNPGEKHGSRMLAAHEDHPLDQVPIYGLYEARSHIRKAGFLILVEGEVDVWQMAAHGIRNVAATLGTKLNAEQISYLESIAISKIVMLPDGDKAGREFALRIARDRPKTKILIKIGELTSGDPDEVLLQSGTEPVNEAIGKARYSFDYLIDRLVQNTPDLNPSSIVDLLHEMRPVFAGSAEYEADLIAARLATIFNMNKEALLDFFRDTNVSVESTLHNLRAERVVLRRMLDDNMFIGDAVTGLTRDDFYLSRHRSIFDAIARLFGSEDAINTDVVRTYLQNIGDRQAIEAVDNLVRSEMVTAGAEFLLGDLRDKSIRRAAISRTREFLSRIGNNGLDAPRLIQTATADLAQIIAGSGEALRSAETLVRDRLVVIHERVKNPNTIIGLDLGPDWKILNHTIHGMQHNRYFVLAAPSGVGKTLVANAWQRRISVELNEPTTMLTFETSPDAMTDRIISSMSGVPSDKIITGYLTEEELELVQDAAAAIRLSPLMITGRGRYIEEAIAIMRHDYLRRGTKVFFLDYIQLMEVQNRSGNMNRTQELGKISGSLFEFSQTHDCTVVVLGQINREGVKRGGKITKEDSGDVYKLGQDADIFYIIREANSEEKELGGPEKGDRRGWLDKHRHGRAQVASNIMADLEVNRIYEV